LLSLLFLASLFSLLWIRKSTRPETSFPLPSSSSSQGEKYQGLIPGVSTFNEVVKFLGDPARTTTDGQTQTVEYKSSLPTQNNLLVFQNQKLALVKEIVTEKDQKNISDFVSKFGETKDILYGPGSSSGFNLYVYSEHGLAYLGNLEGQAVFEIWYFPPTDFSTFKQTYASGYRPTFSPVQ
jgi:hypothetical protein